MAAEAYKYTADALLPVNFLPLKAAPMDVRGYVQDIDHLYKIKKADAWSGMAVVVIDVSALYILKNIDKLETDEVAEAWTCSEEVPISLVSYDEYERLYENWAEKQLADKEHRTPNYPYPETGLMRSDMYYFTYDNDIDVSNFITPKRENFDNDEDYIAAMEEYTRQSKTLGQRYMSAAWGVQIENLLASKASAGEMASVTQLITELDNTVGDENKGLVKDVKDIQEVLGGGQGSNLTQRVEAVETIVGKKGENEEESTGLVKEVEEIKEVLGNGDSEGSLCDRVTLLENKKVVLTDSNASLNSLAVDTISANEYLTIQVSKDNKAVSVKVGLDKISVGDRDLAFADEAPNHVVLSKEEFNTLELAGKLDPDIFYFTYDADDSYATQSYVDEKVSGLRTDITTILSTLYATIKYVNDKVETITTVLGEGDTSGLITTVISNAERLNLLYKTEVNEDEETITSGYVYDLLQAVKNIQDTYVTRDDLKMDDESNDYVFLKKSIYDQDVVNNYNNLKTKKLSIDYGTETIEGESVTKYVDLTSSDKGRLQVATETLAYVSEVPKIVEITQAAYDKLTDEEKDPDTYYMIIEATNRYVTWQEYNNKVTALDTSITNLSASLSNYALKTELTTEINTLDAAYKAADILINNDISDVRKDIEDIKKDYVTKESLGIGGSLGEESEEQEYIFAKQSDFTKHLEDIAEQVSTKEVVTKAVSVDGKVIANTTDRVTIDSNVVAYQSEIPKIVTLTQLEFDNLLDPETEGSPAADTYYMVIDPPKTYATNTELLKAKADAEAYARDYFDDNIKSYSTTVEVKALIKEYSDAGDGLFTNLYETVIQPIKDDIEGIKTDYVTKASLGIGGELGESEELYIFVKQKDFDDYTGGLLKQVTTEKVLFKEEIEVEVPGTQGLEPTTKKIVHSNLVTVNSDNRLEADGNKLAYFEEIPKYEILPLEDFAARTRNANLELEDLKEYEVSTETLDKDENKEPLDENKFYLITEDNRYFLTNSHLSAFSAEILGYVEELNLYLKDDDSPRNYYYRKSEVNALLDEKVDVAFYNTVIKPSIDDKVLLATFQTEINKKLDKSEYLTWKEWAESTLETIETTENVKNLRDTLLEEIDKKVSQVNFEAFVDLDSLYKENNDENIQALQDTKLDNELYLLDLQDLDERLQQMREDITDDIHKVKLLAYNAVELKYLELKQLKEGIAEDGTKGLLIPGRWYRITNYLTMIATDGEYARSKQYPFDILVLALTPSSFSETAYACHHKFEPGVADYFASSKIEAWELKYSFENDTNLYGWAFPGGTGVIYYMKDEFGNECSYDFKNIQFRRYKITNTDPITKVFPFRNKYYGVNIAKILNKYSVSTSEFVWCFTFSKSLYENLTSGSETEDITVDFSKNYDNTGGKLMCRNNKVASLNYTDEYSRQGDFKSVLSNNVWFVGNQGGECSNNIVLGNEFMFNTFGTNCSSCEFGSGNLLLLFGNNCSSTVVKNNCTYLSLDRAPNNTFEGENEDIVLFEGSYGNMFGYECASITLGKGCFSNIFGKRCREIAFVDDVFGNKFEGYCSKIEVNSRNIAYNTVGFNSSNFHLRSQGNYSSAMPLQYLNILLATTSTTDIVISTSKVPIPIKIPYWLLEINGVPLVRSLQALLTEVEGGTG